MATPQDIDGSVPLTIERIEAERVRHGVEQSVLCARAGVDGNTYYRAKNQKTQMRYETRRKLWVALQAIIQGGPADAAPAAAE